MSKPNIQMEYQRRIVGDHGCDRRVAAKILLEGESLKKSNNKYDWLGEWIYFLEYGPQRDLAFAFEQKDRGKVKEPLANALQPRRSR